MIQFLRKRCSWFCLLLLLKKPKIRTRSLFLLKERAGSTATAPTYKLKVTSFRKGTVAEWIDFCKAILELWRQNGITSTQDRETNICTILQGDLLISFEEKLQELIPSTSKDQETEVMEITDKAISASLNAVAQMVFPFRALKITPKTVDATQAKAQKA
jgi:hypothetical protein